MLINEYRVINNCTEQEYQVGKISSMLIVTGIFHLTYFLAQLYATAMASKNSTGGGEGVEVLKNEPYEKGEEKGQYTYKIYRLASRVPKWVSAVAPAGALDLYEEVS